MKYILEVCAFTVQSCIIAREVLIDAGCRRVLTSGQAGTAPEGAGLLKRLVEQANGRISIMPGAGVRSYNITKLIKDTGAYEYHTSARMKVSSRVEFQNPRVTDNGNVYLTDREELERIIKIFSET